MPRPNTRSSTPPPWPGVEGRVGVPSPEAGSLSRTALVNRLRATPAGVVALVAPAGYGKTTLLAQWAERDGRSFAWLTVDESDDDPALLRQSLEAVFGGPVSWPATEKLVLVLDGAHLIASAGSAKIVRQLAAQVPTGSVLAVASRVPPPLPTARLRTSGALLELSGADLALTQREGEALLGGLATELSGEDAAELLERCEGWAAGIRLSALAAQERGVVPGGDDRYLTEYVRAECLDGQSADLRCFLRRTSVLETLTAPVCDALLGRDDSARVLASLEGLQLLGSPVDRQGEGYRYHRLFRDALGRELREAEPELLVPLHGRAADWFEAQGDAESALQHAWGAGDTDRAARIVAAIALPAYYRGRIADVEGWLAAFDDEKLLERYPTIGVTGGWIHALRGRPADAERWLAAAERGTAAEAAAADETSAAASISLLRAALCRDGVDQMCTDIEHALVGLPATSQWRPTALLLLGSALVLRGRDALADAILAGAEESAERLGATDTLVVAISQRSLLASAHERHSAAETHSLRARDVVEQAQLGGYTTSALELAASARASLRHSRWEQARSDLTTARSLTPLLTDALPWLAVQTRLELARAYVTLRDAEGAGELLAEVLDILRRRPDLGVLGEQALELQTEVEALTAGRDVNVPGLTRAELRLLPLLATHLSFREIGARLYVSRNTVKTQAISVYRKLGVSSRSDAIERATELGLVSGAESSPAPLTRSA